MDLRKIDALVAEHVMGWTLRNCDGEPATTPDDYYDAANNDGWTWNGTDEAWTWRPTQDIAAAWEVVEKLQADVTFKRSMGYATVRLKFCDDDGVERSGRANEKYAAIPLAICLAALKAKGIEVPGE